MLFGKGLDNLQQGKQGYTINQERVRLKNLKEGLVFINSSISKENDKIVCYSKRSGNWVFYKLKAVKEGSPGFEYKLTKSVKEGYRVWSQSYGKTMKLLIEINGKIITSKTVRV